MRTSMTERRAWVIGVVSILAIGLGTFTAFSIPKFKGLRGVYNLAADLEDAAGLQPGNEVRIAGVKVGKVTSVGLEPDAARIQMEIDGDIDIPSETLLEVKLKTLLGQKFVDLQFPPSFLGGAAEGEDPADLTAGFLGEGDLIPLDQTKVPFEVYQAASEGTDALEAIDKQALRTMLRVLGKTVGTSKEEINDALIALDRAGEVLGGKSADITRLLRNLEDVTGTLATNDRELDNVLAGGAGVLETLAARRSSTSSLLAAADDLGRTLGFLIQAARGSISVGVGDLNSILVTAEGSLADLEAALAELGPAQRLFGTPLGFGRFTEGHVCAVTTADTCAPEGTPDSPGFPVKGRQPASTKGAL